MKRIQECECLYLCVCGFDITIAHNQKLKTKCNKDDEDADDEEEKKRLRYKKKQNHDTKYCRRSILLQQRNLSFYWLNHRFVGDVFVYVINVSNANI